MKAGSKAKAPRISSSTTQSAASYIWANDSQAASRFRVLRLRFVLRFTLVFLRRCGPFDVLDFVLFFQGILQSFVDRHGEAIGIFAESEAKEFALEVARLTLVLKLKNEEAAVA